MKTLSSLMRDTAIVPTATHRRQVRRADSPRTARGSRRVSSDNANTSFAPVLTYATPSCTTGCASPEYCGATPEPLSRARHTPLSSATLRRVDLIQRRVALVVEIAAVRGPAIGRRRDQSLGREIVRERRRLREQRAETAPWWRAPLPSHARSSPCVPPLPSLYLSQSPRPLKFWPRELWHSDSSTFIGAASCNSASSGSAEWARTWRAGGSRPAMNASATRAIRRKQRRCAARASPPRRRSPSSSRCCRRRARSGS